ncbi:MAG: hypothetical protein JW734_06980 [Candidatus Omnitrophica bacterium]|nr:hypothetical protein [Candidatus Omnitrophota bacterium]
MVQLRSYVVEVKDLSVAEKEQMFKLMVDHFAGVARENFERDLSEKQWAIILRGRDYQIKGFSTYMLLDERVIDGCNVAAIFSGDTIIDRNYWGCWELFKAFGKLSLSLCYEYKKNNVSLYWFLISMGYKTYRLLPVFFKEFYPRCNKKTPVFEKKIIDTFGHYKFSSEYNSRTGVIHFLRERDRLREGVADITRERLKNKHVDFFCRKNPLHKHGDELACIAKFSEDNLRPSALRMIFGAA